MENNPSQKNIRLAITTAVLGFLGFLDATYLTIEHYQGGILPCSIVHGCQVVTTSVYSIVAGIPLPLLGSIYYFIVVALAIYYLDQKKVRVLRALSYFSIIGLLTSLYLLYVQAFDLHAFCLYCIGSATTSTLIFIVGMWILAANKRKLINKTI